MSRRLDLQVPWILAACCVSMEACQKRLTCQDGPKHGSEEAFDERIQAPGRHLTGQDEPQEWP